MSKRIKCTSKLKGLRIKIHTGADREEEEKAARRKARIAAVPTIGVEEVRRLVRAGTKDKTEAGSAMKEGASASYLKPRRKKRRRGKAIKAKVPGCDKV